MPGDVSLDVANDAVEIGLELAQAPVGALELMGMVVALVLEPVGQSTGTVTLLLHDDFVTPRYHSPLTPLLHPRLVSQSSHVNLKFAA